MISWIRIICIVLFNLVLIISQSSCFIRDEDVLDKNFTIPISIVGYENISTSASDKGSDQTIARFVFNVKNLNLENLVNSFCERYHVMQSSCKQLFEAVTKIRYEYFEEEMLKVEYAKNTSIINTQFIPNKHLIRDTFAASAEINNHFKSQEASQIMEQRLNEVFQLIREEIDIGRFRVKGIVRRISFIHSCTIIGERSRILLEIVELMIASGLMKEMEHVFILNYGQDVESPIMDNLIGIYPQIKLIQVSRDTSFFEVPTMYVMRLTAQLISSPESSFMPDINNHQILYLHTKGVSYQQIYQQIEDWRHLMLYFLVERHRTCFHLLASGDYDILGVNYRSNPRDMRGNFWWVRSQYFGSLQKLILIDSNKYTAEKWVYTFPVMRYFSFLESEVDHHHSLFPRERYEREDKVDRLPVRPGDVRDDQYSFTCPGAEGFLNYVKPKR
jgi:hypothetical protein